MRSDDHELEALLTAARPVPSDRFVDALEVKLIGTPRPVRPRFPWRLGALVTGLAAAAVLLLALAGVQPFDGTAQDVRARPACRTVQRPGLVRVPVVRDGKLVVVTKHGRRPVTVCSPRR